MRSAIVAVMCLALLGCQPSSGKMHVIEKAELPSDLYGSAARTPTPADRVVEIFLVKASRLTRTTRVGVFPRNTLLAAISALLEGPTIDEQRAGARTAIPPGTALLTIRDAEGIAVINLSKEFGLAAEREEVVLRLAQVVYTATTDPDIHAVRFRLDGEPIDVTRQDGKVGRETVTRADYASFAPVA